jgi:DNA-binding response OmpR family regulator
MIEVVLVDDDPLMRTLLAEWLSDAGHRVRQSANGEEALQMLRSEPAALLITDMDMPGRDGAHLLREARRLLPGLAVIAISGGTRDWAVTALELGAAKTLAKPFERRQLLSAVEQVVRQGPAPSTAHD